MVRRATESGLPKRNPARVIVPKDDLLRILIAEGFAPEAGRKIIGSGHNLTECIYIVGFEDESSC